MRTYSWFSLLFVLMAGGIFADKPFPLLEEKITYSRQGSRSEARHRYLYVGDRAIPDVFSLVLQEGRLYRFVQRHQAWGDDGYMPVPDALKIQPSSRPMPDEARRRKYYLSKERMDGTPEHWVYVEWGSGTAFVDPIALWKIAEEMKIPVIPRSDPGEMIKHAE